LVMWPRRVWASLVRSPGVSPAQEHNRAGQGQPDPGGGRQLRYATGETAVGLCHAAGRAHGVDRRRPASHLRRVAAVQGGRRPGQRQHRRPYQGHTDPLPRVGAMRGDPMDGVMFGIIIFLAIAGPTSSPSGSTGGAIRTAGCPGGAPSRSQVTPTGTTSGVQVGERGGCRSWVGATAVEGAATAVAAPAEVSLSRVQPGRGGGRRPRGRGAGPPGAPAGRTHEPHVDQGGRGAGHRSRSMPADRSVQQGERSTTVSSRSTLPTSSPRPGGRSRGRSGGDVNHQPEHRNPSAGINTTSINRISTRQAGSGCQQSVSKHASCTLTPHDHTTLDRAVHLRCCDGEGRDVDMAAGGPHPP